MAESSVPGKKVFNLDVVATKLLIKFLEVETNEPTLVTALEMLSNWAAKISFKIPKGISLKTTSPVVRMAYMMCLAFSIKSTLSSVTPLLPSLSLVVDSAGQKSPSEVIVSGAIKAAFLIVRIFVFFQIILFYYAREPPGPPAPLPPCPPCLWPLWIYPS